MKQLIVLLFLISFSYAQSFQCIDNRERNEIMKMYNDGSFYMLKCDNKIQNEMEKLACASEDYKMMFQRASSARYMQYDIRYSKGPHPDDEDFHDKFYGNLIKNFTNEQKLCYDLKHKVQEAHDEIGYAGHNPYHLVGYTDNANKENGYFLSEFEDYVLLLYKDGTAINMYNDCSATNDEGKKGNWYYTVEKRKKYSNKHDYNLNINNNKIKFYNYVDHKGEKPLQLSTYFNCQKPLQTENNTTK